ncbi:MAG: hypothetical protein WCH99_04835 [Verrucomicrobiota bacterium]
MKALAEKNILPTNLDSAGIRALDVFLRSQSFYSAETTNEYLLQKYKDLIGSLLNPATEQRPDRVTATNPEGNVNTGYNPATARTAIQQFLKEMGFSADPEHAGTIKDLSSDARIQLVLQTNKQLAQGQGNWLNSQRSGVLESFPADELFRLEDRAQKRDWLARWRLAGDQTGDPIGTGWTITPDGRLIALKNHDIWNWIGSSELFDDALDVVWPPFAFNSGMWVRDVSRNECEEIGLMDAADAAPEPKNIASALAAFVGKLSKLSEAAS